MPETLQSLHSQCRRNAHAWQRAQTHLKDLRQEHDRVVNHISDLIRREIRRRSRIRLRTGVSWYQRQRPATIREVMMHIEGDKRELGREFPKLGIYFYISARVRKSYNLETKNYSCSDPEKAIEKFIELVTWARHA